MSYFYVFIRRLSEMIQFRDLKYLLAYSIPLMVGIGFLFGGFWTYLTPVYAFGLLPLLDWIVGEDSSNLNKEEAKTKNHHFFYDLMLFLNVPIVFGILAYGFYWYNHFENTTFEIIGMTLSVGIVLGTNAINVAHELGHRKPYFYRFISKLFYLPCFYMHFYIEHNFGHHLHVATPKDGASAKQNQSIYSFWITSVFKQYTHAWKRQMELLKMRKKSFFSIYNDMLWFLFFQLGYAVLMWYLFSVEGLIFTFSIALIAVLLLESINYIEHYGLQRNKLNNGFYERVEPIHSWNSDHKIGRIVLYELTRHSDHHFKADKKYQLLNSHKESPTLPFGYPLAILVGLIPPLWFTIMNKRIPQSNIVK